MVKVWCDIAPDGGSTNVGTGCRAFPRIQSAAPSEARPTSAAAYKQKTPPARGEGGHPIETLPAQPWPATDPSAPARASASSLTSRAPQRPPTRLDRETARHNGFQVPLQPGFGAAEPRRAEEFPVPSLSHHPATTRDIFFPSSLRLTPPPRRLLLDAHRPPASRETGRTSRRAPRGRVRRSTAPAKGWEDRDAREAPTRKPDRVPVVAPRPSDPL